jgi:hypothetical protein
MLKIYMKYLLFLLFVFSFYGVNSSSAYNTTSEGLKCDLCHLGISYVENYLQNNHTETELENVLDNLCYKTPDSNLCIALVNNYLPQIIELVEQKETPAEICSQLSLCDTHFTLLNTTYTLLN